MFFNNVDKPLNQFYGDLPMDIKKDFLAYIDCGGCGTWGRDKNPKEAVGLAIKAFVRDFCTDSGTNTGKKLIIEVADVTGYDKINFGGSRGIWSGDGDDKTFDSVWYTAVVPAKTHKKQVLHGRPYQALLKKALSEMEALPSIEDESDDILIQDGLPL